MPATYTPISVDEMEAIMAEHGFTESLLPGAGERVYSKVWRETGRYSLLAVVYSTVHKRTGASRESGADAIRVNMELVIPGQPRKLVRGSKRVHRTQNWRANLLDRLRSLGDLEPPECRECGLPMVSRKTRQKPAREFWGCAGYPNCKETRGM